MSQLWNVGTALRWNIGHFCRNSGTSELWSVGIAGPARLNKLTNAMFLEQFSDLLESYVSCDRLSVVGDPNVHFDKPSDPSALNVVLDNLSLHQLVNVPTHRRGHTLDWLITNCATDVLDLSLTCCYQTILLFLLTCC